MVDRAGVMLSNLSHAPEAGAVAVAEAEAEIGYRAQLISMLNQKIPNTAEGLPVGFYRVDLLPQCTSGVGADGADRASKALVNFDDDDTMDQIRNAFVELDYSLGYPTLNAGVPYWDKLSFEPGFAYGVFQTYLEMVNFGPRDITKLASNPELRALAGRVYLSGEGEGRGRGEGEGEGEGFTSQQFLPIIYEYMQLYGWRPRAKAYDLYKEAAYKHLRMRRQVSVEDAQFLLSSSILEGIARKMGEAKFLDSLSDTAIVALYDKVTKNQRVSVGLPAANPLPSKERDEDSESSFEMILRSMSLKANLETSNSGPGSMSNAFSHSTHKVLNNLLEDNVTTNQIQEMIVKVTKSVNTNNAS